ncbi:MAG: DMT family transporter [Halanaerobium sp.]|nr:DMT family transporter [Halanaerobium sp.]
MFSNNQDYRTYGFLFIGVLAVSFAAVFIKIAQAPPEIIAFYRLFLATIVISPYVIYKYGREIFRLQAREFFYVFLAGLFLSLHFIFWIDSFNHTSVASSVLILAVEPIFVALISRVAFSEPLYRSLAWGMLLALGGSFIIGYGDFHLGASFLRGDLLALIGTIWAGCYLLVGRRVRRDMEIIPYIFWVYGIASIILGLYAYIKGSPFGGFDTTTWYALVGLALIPTIIGHTFLNWALKHISASLVALSILGEPVGATTLAWLLLGEEPPATSLLGGLVIFAGIYIATSNRGRKAAEEMAPLEP